MIEGRVKFFNSEKGFGFIGTEMTGDFFFHVSHFKGMHIPKTGQFVQFEIVPPKKSGDKPSAINIVVVQRPSTTKLKIPKTETVPERTFTDQYSECNACNTEVEAYKVTDGRAFYSCACGKRWNGRPFYGRHVPMDGAVFVGVILGTFVGVVAGGFFDAVILAPIGAIVGGIIGLSTGKASECLKCGGTGRPTGSRGDKTMYQCENCRSTWVERN